MTAHPRFTVLHIFSGDLWAGAEVMIYHLLVELKAKGVNILALSLNEGILASKLRDAGIETFVIPENQHHFATILLQALYLFRASNIDIIHSHRYKENLLAMVLARILSIKRLVTTIHGLVEIPHHMRARARTRLKETLNYFVLRHYFTSVVAVSGEIGAATIEKHRIPSGKVAIIRNGIVLPPELNSNGRSRKTSSFHVGTVGRLTAVKDYDLFLNVAAEVKKQISSVRFSILGDGPLKECLLCKAKELEVADCVKFISGNPDPFAYYRSLDVYLNTSVHEGIPMSILEAMACGLPVVAPRVGGIPEIISHGRDGFLVGERKPEKFAEVCVTLNGNESLRKEMGRNSKNRIADSFTSSQMASSYLSIYLCSLGYHE